MTVPGAIAVMETVVARFGAGVIGGAGTVLDAETARACILAGARFCREPRARSGHYRLWRLRGLNPERAVCSENPDIHFVVGKGSIPAGMPQPGIIHTHTIGMAGFPDDIALQLFPVHAVF